MCVYFRKIIPVLIFKKDFNMRTDANVTPVPLPQHEGDWFKDVSYQFGALTLVIEYLAGEIRTKTRRGMVIKNEFPVAYGRILNTTDLHGEEIDFYLASMPSEEGEIYVIDQIDPATGLFDEHKVMLGFSSIPETIHVYTSVFGDGSGNKRIGAITTFTADSFNAWIHADGSALVPASSAKAPGVIPQRVNGIQPPMFHGQGMTAPRDEVGGIIVQLTDMSDGPKIQTQALAPDAFAYHLYFFSALTHDVWSNPMDVFCRILDRASERDVVYIHVASPGGSVILMGRVISAINRTKAKVITIAEGCVASAATAIWAAGHERQIRPGAYFMQHMSSQLLAGKTTDIQAKSGFCVDYITKRLDALVKIGLFTEEEKDDMITKSSDVYISGREAIARMGEISHADRAK
jgi:ATP-dependent protease ClpP protease subunit